MSCTICKIINYNKPKIWYLQEASIQKYRDGRLDGKNQPMLVMACNSGLVIS